MYQYRASEKSLVEEQSTEAIDENREFSCRSRKEESLVEN